MKALWLLAFGWAAVCQEPAHFSTEVQLVTIDVQVTEKGTGRVLDLLSPRDFVVYDDGKQREIRLYQFGTMPIDFVFLSYGKSGWGTLKDRQEFNRGLNAAPAEMMAGDRGAVLRTESASKIDLSMTDDREAVRFALVRGGKYAPGYDHLYDAVRAAISLFPGRKEPGRRRTIVTITDDLESKSKTSLEQLITDLLESDVTLNEITLAFRRATGEIGFGGTWGTPRIRRQIADEPSGASLLEAVEATGGQGVPGDLFRERFPALIRQIRMRYLLGFYAQPALTREFHSIEVRLTPEARLRYPDALIRARSGYYSVAAGK